MLNKACGVGDVFVSPQLYKIGEACPSDRNDSDKKIKGAKKKRLYAMAVFMNAYFLRLFEFRIGGKNKKAKAQA
ncbi:MAG: hypothetical protein J5930_01015 [Treponema sp.]|nr:hypothetical protein [Treponema sp.]